jgi:flagellar hook protein FlgE
MGLGSVLNTAASGLSATTTLVEVAANNLANSQTPGFKASHVELATQPVSAAGVGQGVQVAGIGVDASQGPIASADLPALLALEGEGLFILEGASGERLYTRDGRFGLNASGELVTRDGHRVLGHAALSDGTFDTSQLVPLRIALGSPVASSNGQYATLRSYAVQRDGRIVGHYSDGVARSLGQLRIARFPNPGGLTQRTGNTLRSSPASGLARESNPAAGGAAQVISGAVELSNVDLGRELVELTLAENLFRANLLVLDTADSLLDELFFPWRAR